VVNSGVYVLEQGALVFDAIESAGGFTTDADRSSVNLSATLKDGMQIHIYKTGDVPQKVNINTAEVWLLVAVILVFSIYQMRGIRNGLMTQKLPAMRIAMKSTDRIVCVRSRVAEVLSDICPSP
jgi:protein involved in polysaccharide export with SLBB domain